MSIVFKNATVRIGERVVLNDVGVSLSQRRIGVIGANGSGKSTLARLVNGLVLPDRGNVFVFGMNTRTQTRKVRQKVGFVFQNPDNQIVFPIVSEDVAFGLRNIGLGKNEAAAKAASALERFGLAHLSERPTHALSGGEKQMVALVSVLVMEPDLVVLDEPTTQLDLRSRNHLRNALDGLTQMVVVVTHDLDLIGDFDRVLVIDEGCVVVDDKPRAALAWYVEHRS